MTDKLRDAAQEPTPDWISYNKHSDVLTIRGRRYAAALFDERGFGSPPGTLLRIVDGPADVVTLERVAEQQDAQAVNRGYDPGFITRLATLVDKETKQILEDSLSLIEQIKYMVGIAERGTGKKCPADERPEIFLLDYVKSLEAALAQQDAQKVPQDLSEAFRAELDKVSQRNFELRMEIASLKATPTSPVQQDAQAPGSDIPGAVRRPLE